MPNKSTYKISDILAVISSIGIIAWIISDFYGGMIIWTISYWYIIFPLAIIYIISFLDTLTNILKHSLSKNRIQAASHFTVLIIIIAFNIYHSEILKSKAVISATLNDDLYHYTLVFRENGICENNITGMFGFQEKFEGEYTMNGDTIILTKIPYDNDNFLPDTLLIDNKDNALYFIKDQNGNFKREKEYLSYLEINP